MPPIDWNGATEKHPLKSDSPASLLARKWQTRILYHYGWARTYLVALIFTLYFIAIIIWWEVSAMPVGWSGQGVLQQLAVMLVPPIAILVRVHIASVPALTVMADTRETLLEHFRMTLIEANDLTKAMLYHSFYYGAMPLATFSTIETLFYLHAIGTDMGQVTIFLRAPLVFLLYIALGMLLSGLGLVGVLIWRNVYGAILGVISPMIVTALFAGPDYIWTLVTSFGTRAPSPIGHNLATLIIVPENSIAFSEHAVSRHGFTTLSATDPGLIFGMILILLVFGGLVWIGLWAVLRQRL
jgi:hypothetical protein